MLRILSYNIHKGFSVANRRFVLDGIKEAIHLVQPDLVFLQEVIGEHRIHKEEIDGWPDGSQFEYLAGDVWSHVAYGKNKIHSDGHHGNALISKYPILSWENIDVSTGSYERRGVLCATVEIPGWGVPLRCFCVHLGLKLSSRALQLEQIGKQIESITGEHDPLIIAGDFNDWSLRASPALQKTSQLKEAHKTLHGHHPRTFPSWLPLLQLDRIYYRNLRPLEADVLTGEPWRKLSDHAALFAAVTPRLS